MSAIWLVIYPYGLWRTRRSEDGRPGRRVYQKLPSDLWLREALVEFGQGLDRQVLRNLGGGYHPELKHVRPALQLRALLRLDSTGSAYHQSDLSPWSPRLQLLRSYLGWPTDCHSLRVADVKPVFHHDDLPQGSVSSGWIRPVANKCIMQIVPPCLGR